MLAALKLLADLNRSGKRDVPADAPMPFRNEWCRLVMDGARPYRRLYETAVLATLRDKLRSGGIWVECRSTPTSCRRSSCGGQSWPAGNRRRVAGHEGGELDRRLKRFARRLRPVENPPITDVADTEEAEVHPLSFWSYAVDVNFALFTATGVIPHV
jgi:hypothetical protein